MFKISESPISYKVEKRLGVISESPNGWSKELNVVAWNNGAGRHEIRSWSPDHTRMGKGISFTREELGALTNMLLRIEDIRDLIDFDLVSNA